MFKVQIKDGPRAAWRAVRFSPVSFATLDAALAFAKSLDQDGYFSFSDATVQIIDAVGNRVNGKGM